MKKEQNKLFIISGPSGSGQDSVIKGLQQHLAIERVITTTTREMRAGEKQGSPYYFIWKKEFENLIKQGRLFEWAQEYNDNYYGVTHEEIQRVQNSENIGIWKIEYQGVITAKQLLPKIIAIFIYSPLEILEKRIRERNPEYSEDFIQERLNYTKEFLKHKHIYDFVVENKQGKLAETIAKVAEIIKENTNIDKS